MKYTERFIMQRHIQVHINTFLDKYTMGLVLVNQHIY